MHLAPAVIRAHICIGYERNDKVSIGKVRGNALLPLASHLDAFIIPDIIAAAVHIADYGQNSVIIRVRIAYKYVRLVTLVGLEILKIAHNSLLLTEEL